MLHTPLSQHFVESVFFFNNYEGHDKYNRFDGRCESSVAVSGVAMGCVGAGRKVDPLRLQICAGCRPPMQLPLCWQWC